MAKGDFSQQIQEQYQANLGRVPTKAEIDFFNTLFQSKDISAYELGAFLQGHPERMESRLNQYGQQLEGQLAASDADILNKAQGVAVSNAARLGRPDTSMIGAQMAQAGQNLAMNRQSALAQFYGQGFGNQMGAYQDRSQGALSRAYGLGDQRRQWAHERDIYQLQKNDYNDYLNAANRRAKQQGWASLAGGIAGGLAGAYLAPAGGGAIGAGVGSRIGSGFGGLF